jgi:hypothetical protein
MGIVVTDGRLQWCRESKRRQCDESKQRRWDSLSGYLEVDFWLFSVAVWVTLFPLLTNLDPNFGVTHVGIGYCITSSDILIHVQILLTEGICWN